MKSARWQIALCGLALGLSSGLARAEAGLPRVTRAVRVDERPGAQVPRELVFTTPEGDPAPLAASIPGDLPVLLVFAYARCSSLCSVVLRAMTTLMAEMPALEPGRDYRPLLISLDPDQSLEAARRHQHALLKQLELPGQTSRFSYLLGRAPQIAQLADAVGFRYAWDPRTKQYAHPAVLIVLDRAGRVFQYVQALGTRPDELAQVLTASARATTPAAQGSLAGDLLRCFRFDPALRRQRENIALYFRIGGAVLLALLGTLLSLLLRWERRRGA